MNVGIIGCGLIGEKRAKGLGPHTLLMTADINEERARRVAGAAKNKASNLKTTTRWQDVVENHNIDVVVVATTNDLLTPIGIETLKRGKHILLEKPAARTFAEITQLWQLARDQEKSGKRAKIGFNLRYHPALMKAKGIIDEGGVGPLMFVRGRYGHGGRVGYDKEWRSNREVSGGGELIDQGVHLIDLSRWILGDLSLDYGSVHTYFWNMPVDDNGFMSLKAKQGQTAWLHVSCSEWKNLFCLEIYGRTGKLQIDGIGGSYGTEKLTYYRMLPEMGPPETTSWEFPGEDRSWHEEFAAFTYAIEHGGPLCGDVNDAYEALSIVDQIYKGNSR